MAPPSEDQDSTPDLVARAVDHGLLRQALELAVLVARNGADARPPIPPPGSLRPLLRHTKWTPRARTSVARVLDTDEEFRMRVAEEAEHIDVDHLGTASRLWLVRPEGWQEDLADLVNELDTAEEARLADREERQARRQVGELTAELERRRQEAEVAVRRAAELESDLSEARRERRETAALAEALGEQLMLARAEAERWQKSAEEAECVLDEHRRALLEASREANALRDEESRLRERIAELTQELTEAEARQEADHSATVDLRQSVARAVGEAATAAAALGEALAVASRSIVERVSLPPDSVLPGRSGPGLPGPSDSGSRRGSDAPGAAHSTLEPGADDAAPGGPDLPSGGGGSGLLAGPAGAARALALLAGSSEATAAPEAPTSTETTTRPGGVRQTEAGGAEARRRPQPLPPAVFEDSPEAAAHLVRGGVLLLVDGYNLSLFAWPELSLPAQRHRVTTALAELAFRTGASVRVVFDGDDQVAYPETRGGARTPVRVLFSTPGVDADEVIIGLVDEHPPDRAVVVATSDRRVQDEVRRRGANVITTPQLLGLLRRTGTR